MNSGSAIVFSIVMCPSSGSAFREKADVFLKKSIWNPNDTLVVTTCLDWNGASKRKCVENYRDGGHIEYFCTTYSSPMNSTQNLMRTHIDRTNLFIGPLAFASIDYRHKAYFYFFSKNVRNEVVFDNSRIPPNNHWNIIYSSSVNMSRKVRYSKCAPSHYFQTVLFVLP
jgi:hypothetical protein